MQTRRKKLTPLDRQAYIKLFVRVVEAINPLDILTSREIDVLSTFLSFEGEVASKARFSAAFRKEAMNRLGMKTAQMSNILIGLRKKGIIKKEGGIDVVVPAYVPPDDGVEINLILYGPVSR